MDLLDRFLGHDRATTAQSLQISRDLTDAQLDRPFDIGHETLRETFQHMIGNVETWTDMMHSRTATRSRGGSSMDALIERHERSYAAFADLARRLRDEGLFDAYYVDTLDDPPVRKTFGGTIVHVITHNMLHRCEALHILKRLGVAGLPEGDALSWEASIRG